MDNHLCEKAKGRGYVVTLEEYLPLDFRGRCGNLIVCD